MDLSSLACDEENVSLYQVPPASWLGYLEQKTNGRKTSIRIHLICLPHAGAFGEDWKKQQHFSIKKNFFFRFIYLLCVSVLSACTCVCALHVCLVPLRVGKNCIRSPELELQRVVTSHVDVESQTNTQCS